MRCPPRPLLGRPGNGPGAWCESSCPLSGFAHSPIGMICSGSSAEGCLPFVSPSRAAECASVCVPVGGWLAFLRMCGGTDFVPLRVRAPCRLSGGLTPFVEILPMCVRYSCSPRGLWSDLLTRPRVDLSPPRCASVSGFSAKTIHRGHFARLLRQSMHSLRFLVGRFCSDRFITELSAPPICPPAHVLGFPSDEHVLRPPVLLQESGGRPVKVVLGVEGPSHRGTEAFQSLGPSRFL